VPADNGGEVTYYITTHSPLNLHFFIFKKIKMPLKYERHFKISKSYLHRFQATIPNKEYVILIISKKDIIEFYLHYIVYHISVL
jgi:hypothetical protein